MTRVNVIPPELLTDQHLIAEHLEHSFVVSSFWRSLRSKKGIEASMIPEEYCLGKGHVTFFYNKFGFLQERHYSLQVEAAKRNISLTEGLNLQGIESKWMGLWAPNSCALKKNANRILDRIELKPTWYRYYGIPFNGETYLSFIQQYQFIISRC